MGGPHALVMRNGRRLKGWADGMVSFPFLGRAMAQMWLLGAP